MRIFYLSFLFFLGISINPSLAQKSKERPKLGYALSGGGAKGLAHIGVLEVLEANGILPDYITGTSMGSIVGSLYAMGYSPKEMVELANGIEWDYYFTDSYPRTYLPIEERSGLDRYLLSFAIRDNGQLVLPKGLIGGKKILNLLGNISAPVHTIKDFSHFYIPFRCVATDLETGQAHVFKEGSLRHAIRASMSIPSAFEPLEYDGRLLIDGMVARNLPVKDAFDMGSDIVIGVDVGSPLYKKEELNSVLKVLEQTSSYGMVKSTREQRQLASILIDPNLDGYSALSYDGTDSLIQRGRQAALQALPMIKSRLDSLGWKTQRIPDHPHLQRDSFYITQVTFLGDNGTTRRTLKQLVKIKTPALVTIDQLSKLSGLLYSSGFFSMVDYEFRNTEDGDGYELHFEAKGTPDYYVKLGVNYDTDFNAGFLLNFTARNQLVNGSLFSTDVRISEFPGVWLKYLIYTRSQPSVGIQLKAGAQMIPGNSFTNGRLVDEFAFQDFQLELNLQASISRQWYFIAGLKKEIFSDNPRFFTIDDDGSKLKQWSILAQFIRDTYDRSYFPTGGTLTHLWAQLGLSGTINDQTMNGQELATNGDIRLGGNLHKAFNIAPKWWLDFSLGAGYSILQKDHLLQRFYLGRSVPDNTRFFEVYGFQQSELMATQFGYGRLQFRHQLAGKYFIGLGYNYGKWLLQNNDSPDNKGDINGIGLELGSMTPLGPVRFTTEYNVDYNRFNFSFFLGYRF